MVLTQSRIDPGRNNFSKMKMENVRNAFIVSCIEN